MVNKLTEQASKPPQAKLKSKEHEQILDIIDDLRSQGISRFIDLPQIVVCGDQSSGKSSVLEGVSGLHFPVKDDVCTRHATEILMRNSPEISSIITIVPDANRPDDEKQRLQQFKYDGDIYEKLGHIIDEAGKAMGIDGATKSFSSDVLRIELSGPEQPHLTLVDLPGVFHSGSKSQSANDAIAVQSLVTSYMQKSRSIVLAVISAKNDLNNQIITRYVSDYDCASRTLGIITKPDTLPKSSDSEKKFFELAQNKDVKFAHGWHVLKNRDYEQRNCSNEERDASEKLFLSDGIWASLSSKQLGIDTLRSRLSNVLKIQILHELPSLLRDVDAGINDCQSRLALLGTARSTSREQSIYLHRVSETFTTILREAVRGRYDNKYFSEPETPEGYLKRLCAITKNMLDDFTTAARTRGHKYQVVDDEDDDVSEQQTEGDFPIAISRKDRLWDVKELIKRSRGMELATVIKEEYCTALFREQSSPWVRLAKDFAEEIFATVKSSVYLALEFTSDQTTRDGVLRHVVNPGLAQIKAGFDAAVHKILYQHVHGHPMTNNHYLTDNLQKLRGKHQKTHVAAQLDSYFGRNPLETSPCVTDSVQVNLVGLLNHLTKPRSEEDMMIFTCSEALHIMEAYYKVALKRYIDDMTIYAVQEALLDKLEALFNPTTLFTLEKDVIQQIAGETEDSRLERAHIEKKLAVLTKASEVLKKLDTGDRTSKCTPMSFVPEKKLKNSSRKGESLKVVKPETPVQEMPPRLNEKLSI